MSRMTFTLNGLIAGWNLDFRGAQLQEELEAARAEYDEMQAQRRPTRGVRTLSA